MHVHACMHARARAYASGCTAGIEHSGEEEEKRSGALSTDERSAALKMAMRLPTCVGMHVCVLACVRAQASERVSERVSERMSE